MCRDWTDEVLLLKFLWFFLTPLKQSAGISFSLSNMDTFCITDNITFEVVILPSFTLRVRLLYDLYRALNCLSSYQCAADDVRTGKGHRRGTPFPTQRDAGCQAGGIKITCLQRPTYWQSPHAPHGIVFKHPDAHRAARRGWGEGCLQVGDVLSILLCPLSVKCRKKCSLQQFSTDQSVAWIH